MGLSTFCQLALLSVVVVAVVISCCHRARLQSIDRLANSDRLKYSTQIHNHTYTLTVIYATCVCVCVYFMNAAKTSFGFPFPLRNAFFLN